MCARTNPSSPTTPHPAVVANLVYATVGVFAAARYGLATEGDVLVNSWLPGRWDGVLDGLVAIYLSISMVGARLCLISTSSIELRLTAMAEVHVVVAWRAAAVHPLNLPSLTEELMLAGCA